MSELNGHPIRVLTGSGGLPLGASVWPCYEQVFGDFADYATWRSDLFERHARRDGYRLAAAIDDDQVIGFAWGYVGQRGQYWTDLVHDALLHEVVAQWVGDHFEIVELVVLPGHRRNGLGQMLHDRLLDGVKRRCLLSTSDDPDDPAVRLYTRSVEEARNAQARRAGDGPRPDLSRGTYLPPTNFTGSARVCR